MQRVVLAFLAIITFSLGYAQESVLDDQEYLLSLIDSNRVFNSKLSTEEANQSHNQAAVEAERLFNALVHDNETVLATFFPSREEYLEMIVNFGFETEYERVQAIKNWEQYYDQEKLRVLENLEETATKVNSLGNVSYDSFQMEMTDNVKVKGGRAAVIFTDENGAEHAFAIYKYYEWENNWYVTNKLVWRF